MKINTKKGFTLIELLAVIVILAIIALIATPIIIGVINKARAKSAENSTFGVIDAARLAYTESIMSSATFTFGSEYDVTQLSVSGDKPKSGKFSIGADGEITVKDLQFTDYKCAGNTKGVSCSR